MIATEQLSTTTEDTLTAPPPSVREPTMLEQITGLTETVRRVAAERDEARARVAQLAEDLETERLRADRSEAYGVVLANENLARAAAMRDLARRLTDTERALREALAPAQPPRDCEAVAAPARIPEPPLRPVRRRPWRKPHNRRH